MLWFFPVVMCGCEKWTISAKGRGPKTVELKKTLESPLESREMKPGNPKRNQTDYPLEGLMLKLKLQYFVYPT